MIMISQFFRDLKQEFKGYNAAKLMKDVMAGLTVCAVALPLALAFGVSSGATAASGLVTAWPVSSSPFWAALPIRSPALPAL